MKKTISILLMLSLFLTFNYTFTGCSKSYGGNVVTFETDEIPKTLDPLLASGTTERTIVQNIFEPLVVVTNSGEITAGGAESYSVSPDGRTLSFALRKDARWSDERPVTAADYVFALRRAADPSTKWSDADSIKNIKNAAQILEGRQAVSSLGVSADGDYGLVITLESRDDSLLFTLGGAAGVPCREEFFTASGGKYGMTKDATVSNGPFYVSRWIQSEGEEALKISKNKEYSGPREAVSSGIYFSFEKEDGRLTRIRNGNSDCGVISHENVASASDYTLLSYYDSCVSLVFSTVEGAPTQNAELRRALYLSADRTCLNTVLPAYCEAAGGVVLPGSFSTAGIYRADNSSILPASDELSANEAFEAAKGALGAKTLSGLKAVYEEGAMQKTILNYSIQRWQKLFGIVVEATPAPASQIPSLLASGQYQLAVCSVSPSENSAFSALSQYARNSSGAGAVVEDEGFLGILSQAAQSPDKQREAEQYLINQHLVMPLYYTKKYFVFSKTVVNPALDLFSATVDFTGTGIYD